MTDDDRSVLDLESQFWKYAGTKEAAIREQLGITPLRYYQRLARLLTDPAAAAYAPAVVRRARGIAEGQRRTVRL